MFYSIAVAAAIRNRKKITADLGCCGKLGMCMRCNVAREVVAGGVDHIGKYVPNPIPRNL